MFYREYQQRDNEEKRAKETGKGKREREIVNRHKT